MKRNIEKELLNLGAPTGRLGYAQLACALELIMQSPQVTSTTRVLYPKVAEFCDTKPARIERNVREEIKAIWDFGTRNAWMRCSTTAENTRWATKSFYTRLRGTLSNATQMPNRSLPAVHFSIHFRYCMQNHPVA